MKDPYEQRDEDARTIAAATERVLSRANETPAPPHPLVAANVTRIARARPGLAHEPSAREPGVNARIEHVAQLRASLDRFRR